jgi:predicted nucleic acid-binding protein
VRVVLDASVIVKWLLADPGREPDTERATALLESVVAGELEILQPFHWLAEVAAVLVRLSPATAADDVLMLRAMEIPTSDEAEVLRRACILAIETQQHLFDTLYHAVALENADSVLVTADDY